MQFYQQESASVFGDPTDLDAEWRCSGHCEGFHGRWTFHRPIGLISSLVAASNLTCVVNTLRQMSFERRSSGIKPTGRSYRQCSQIQRRSYDKVLFDHCSCTRLRSWVGCNCPGSRCEWSHCDSSVRVCVRRKNTRCEHIQGEPRLLA